MTETEYKAYLLYLKSIEIMQSAKVKEDSMFSLDRYLSDTENINEIEIGLDDINAGRITFIDPENVWESIK